MRDGEEVLKKVRSPEGTVSTRPMGMAWADGMSQARKQRARIQVREKECAGEERSVKARRIDRRVASDWNQIVKDLYQLC